MSATGGTVGISNITRSDLRMDIEFLMHVAAKPQACQLCRCDHYVCKADGYSHCKPVYRGEI